jgi:HSP20 family protein
MRYRHLSYRYAMIATGAQLMPLGSPYRATVMLAQPRWRPDADVYETEDSIRVIIDLAGIDEESVDVTLFEDALVVEGQRRLPAEARDAVYHAASIRQGPFQLALSFAVTLDRSRVEARYERGLLHVTLAKASGS